MELSRIEIAERAGGERVRLRGDVRYDDTGEVESYWFDVPAHVADTLSRDGTPWLVALLPLAATLNAPLRIALPVDARILRQAVEMMMIWRAWYPQLGTPRIDADVRPDVERSGVDARLNVRPDVEIPGVDARQGSRTGAFFSGGVDSFFTALRPRNGAEPAIDELVSVWGFDIPLEHDDAISRLRGRFSAVARDLGVKFVDVATNIRATRWRESDWATVAHGCALGAVALALEPRFASVMIAATGGYRDLHPWGSHPLTDPLLSTLRTTIIHDGAAFTRTEKTRLLATSAVAMRDLRVCWRSRTDANCEACSKCYRTMLILELLGALPACATFASNSVDLRAAERVLCAQPWDYREFRDIHALALTAGRPDIAEVAERVMSRSRVLGRRLDRVRAWRGHRVLAPIARRVERRLLAGWIE